MTIFERIALIKRTKARDLMWSRQFLETTSRNVQAHISLKYRQHPFLRRQFRHAHRISSSNKRVCCFMQSIYASTPTVTDRYPGKHTLDIRCARTPIKHSNIPITTLRMINPKELQPQPVAQHEAQCFLAPCHRRITDSALSDAHDARQRRTAQLCSARAGLPCFTVGTEYLPKS